jgi:hypothetical protein
MSLVPDLAFDDLLKREINISANQISQGSTSHNYIRTLLNNKCEHDSNFPWLTDGDFLSGSYARGTKIYPLDDIDVMVVIDGTGLLAIQDGQVLPATVRGGNKLGSPMQNYLSSNGLLSSQVVLQLFQNALKQSHPESKVSKDGQAINVQLKASGIGIDVVPCFHVIPNNGGQDVYYIPVGYGRDDWMITNPKIDQSISDYLHERHNRKLKSIIKLLKYWNREGNNERLRSYHLETMAWYIFHNHPSAIDNYADGVKYFFQSADQYLGQPCSDITKLGGPVDSYLSIEDRIASRIRIQQICQLLRPPSLPLIASVSEQRELRSWQAIFNNKLDI